MSGEQFIILNILILLFLGAAFFWSNKNARFSMEEIEKENTKEREKERVREKVNQDYAEQVNQSEKYPNVIDRNISRISNSELFKATEIQKGLFIYNGHTWNAFEVLGVSPECSSEKLRDAFENALQRSELSSHEFLKSALDTILSEVNFNQREKF